MVQEPVFVGQPEFERYHNNILHFPNGGVGTNKFLHSDVQLTYGSFHYLSHDVIIVTSCLVNVTAAMLDQEYPR